LNNFFVAEEIGFDITDISFMGLGKGGGNLRVEHCVDLDYSVKLADIWYNFGIEPHLMREFYYFLSGVKSTVDHYADWAYEAHYNPGSFLEILDSLSPEQKNAIDKNFISAAPARFI